MNTIELTYDEAHEAVNKAIMEDVISVRRWTTVYRIVFEKDMKHYSFEYEYGLTENQDLDEEDMFGPEPVIATEVKIIPTITYKWVTA